MVENHGSVDGNIVKLSTLRPYPYPYADSDAYTINRYATSTVTPISSISQLSLGVPLPVQFVPIK